VQKPAVDRMSPTEEAEGALPRMKFWRGEYELYKFTQNKARFIQLIEEGKALNHAEFPHVYISKRLYKALGEPPKMTIILVPHTSDQPAISIEVKPK